MSNCIYVPGSLRSAGKHLRNAFQRGPSELPKGDFLRSWCSLAYLFPGLHPDGFEDVDSGWPRALKPMASEAWRRAESGELADDELYPSDAQWAGLYDRMLVHLPDETERRVELAALFGQPENA
jgi:hypothetical protein